MLLELILKLLQMILLTHLQTREKQYSYLGSTFSFLSTYNAIYLEFLKVQDTIQEK